MILLVWRFAIVFLANLQKMSFSSLVRTYVLVSQYGCTMQCTLTVIRKSCLHLVGSMTASSQQHKTSCCSISLTCLDCNHQRFSKLGVLMCIGETVQILHVRNSHWSIASNVGCEDDVVKYYDSMYTSAFLVTTVYCQLCV